MTLYEQEPTLTRALALALMRKALELLDATRELAAAAELQRSIDTLLESTRSAGQAAPTAR
jgi:hypothetical protein